MKKKRICIIRHGPFPEDIRVRKEAFALVERGYEVDVISSETDKNIKKIEVVNGVNVYRLPVPKTRGGIIRYLYEYGYFFLAATLKLCAFHFKKPYDVIQVNTLPDYLIFVTLIPKLFGVKTVLDLHEPSPELMGLKFGTDKKLLIWFVKMAEKLAIMYTDRAITVSEQMKENYIKRGAEPSKISIVLNVPNLEFNYDLYKEELKRVKDDRFTLVCHGTIIKRYGQDIAVQAIALLKDEIPDIQLKIMGTGEYVVEIKRLVSELKIEDHVHFLGFIPFLDMVMTVGSTDIGLVPVQRNVYSDLIHTNKMFEFIAMKRPVVISRTRAVEDFFGADDTCFEYFESGNPKDLARAILTLYKDQKKRETMAENAYKRFESVSWEITKEHYCDIFDELSKQ